MGADCTVCSDCKKGEDKTEFHTFPAVFFFFIDF